MNSGAPKTQGLAHRPVHCTKCGAYAHRWMAVGDLTIYLCEQHIDLCGVCLRVAKENICDEGNLCASCRANGETRETELADYSCREGCVVCEA